MEQKDAQLRLFERIKEQAWWLGKPHTIFDDLVQEAWLLTLDYAQKRGKRLDELSKTELRFRCFEAKRKIIAPYQEQFFGEDFIELAAEKLPAIEDIVGAEIKTSDSFEGRLSRLTWLLELHPVLKLTDYQRVLWGLMRREDKHGWQADYARERLITRQAVNKTTATIRKKITLTADLLRLADGDIDYFFNRYGRQWNSRLLRIILVNLFRPQLGVRVNPELVQFFLPLQNSFIKKATNILQEEVKHITADNPARPENLALGCNLFYLADHMADHRSNSSLLTSVAEEILKDGGRIEPFFDVAFKLYKYLHSDSSLVKKYNDWLHERLEINDQSGRDYANYHLAYYHSISEVKKSEFLKSAGKAVPEEFSYQEIISCTYVNTKNSFYAKNLRLLDLNFLRFLLIKKHFPFDQRLLPLHSQHALKILAQQALHSKESLVVRGAEEILTSIGV